MKSDIKIAFYSVLITASFEAVFGSLNHLSGAGQNIGSIVLWILGFWIYFDGIVKLIYKQVGAKKGDRLNHRQANLVGRYWTVWLLSSVVTSVAYFAIFQHNHLKGSLIAGGLFLLLIILGYVNTRQKIMGHTKEEIFK